MSKKFAHCTRTAVGNTKRPTNTPVIIQGKLIPPYLYTIIQHEQTSCEISLVTLQGLHMRVLPSFRELFSFAIHDVKTMRSVEVCKWCGESNSHTILEGAPVCTACFEKGTRASQNARLCSSCNRIFTDKNFIQDLFSEYGASHVSAEHLRESAENGCSMCRMLLLQDPNNDPARLQMNLSLLAERPEGAASFQSGKAPSAGDINLLYFTSEGGQFRLDMSVSALAGMSSIPEIYNQLSRAKTTLLQEL